MWINMKNDDDETVFSYNYTIFATALIPYSPITIPELNTQLALGK